MSNPRKTPTTVLTAPDSLGGEALGPPAMERVRLAAFSSSTITPPPPPSALTVTLVRVTVDILSDPRARAIVRDIAAHITTAFLRALGPTPHGRSPGPEARAARTNSRMTRGNGAVGIDRKKAAKGKRKRAPK